MKFRAHLADLTKQIVYMNFKKAFDPVSRYHLLDKLQAFGIVGKAREWFEAYLRNHNQCVKIGDSGFQKKNNRSWYDFNCFLLQTQESRQYRRILFS